MTDNDDTTLSKMAALERALNTPYLATIHRNRVGALALGIVGALALTILVYDTTDPSAVILLLIFSLGCISLPSLLYPQARGETPLLPREGPVWRIERLLRDIIGFLSWIILLFQQIPGLGSYDRRVGIALWLVVILIEGIHQARWAFSRSAPS